MALVHIPPMWLPLTGMDKVQVDAANIANLLVGLTDRFPSLDKWILNEHGAPTEWINIWLNERDIRMLQGVDTPVSSADEIWIIIAISGG
jgi:molybdopterin synthase sulfur carrier subunit